MRWRVSLQAVLVLAAACSGDNGETSGDAGASCAPPFPIAKTICGSWGARDPCPEGQYCLDYDTCAPIGCASGPDCAVPDSQSGHVSVSPQPFDYGPLPSPIHGTVRSVTGSIIDVEYDGKVAELVVPKAMVPPVKEGDAITLELCRHGPLWGYVYAVLVRDRDGVLLFAGASGVDPTECPFFSTSEIKISRVELGCAPSRPFPPMAEEPYVSFALRFVGDTGITLPQGGRGAVSIAGRQYDVANFVSFHPIEWTATDVGGALEYFAVVLRP